MNDISNFIQKLNKEEIDTIKLLFVNCEKNLYDKFTQTWENLSNLRIEIAPLIKRNKMKIIEEEKRKKEEEGERKKREEEKRKKEEEEKRKRRFNIIKTLLEEDYGLSNNGWSDEELMRKIEKYSNDNKAISKIVEMIGEELLELKMNQKNF